jgi:uncharacterized membrane protein
VALVVVVTLLGAGWGCGGADAVVAPVCPNDTPASCPTPAPSYATDVAPVLESRCGACHTPAGVEPSRLFQTYTQVAAQANDILGQIHTCRMPPAGQPALTDGERQAVLGWVVCGAVNN